MIRPAELDHIVVNTRTDLDKAAAIFTAIGFTLTPRGTHSMGSINHLAMFGSDYLELIGVPKGSENLRPEVAHAPPGLNGIVCKTHDVEATHAHLQAEGAAGAPPKSFSRPVEIAGGDTREARFRTVAASAEAFPAGRLYFCQHLTPDLLWRQEWMTHANGVSGFCEVVVVTEGDTAAGETAAIAGAVEAGAAATLKGGFTLTFLTPRAYRERFAAAARSMNGRAAMLGAVVLAAPDPQEIRMRAEPLDIAAHCCGSDLVLAVDAFDLAIGFRG